MSYQDEQTPEEQQLAQEQYEAGLRAEVEKLYKQVPEWRDEKIRHAELDSLTAHAKANGFSEEELRACGARELAALRKGWEFDGRPKTKDQRTADVAKAKHTLRQSGKTKDAASAIEKLLNKRGR